MAALLEADRLVGGPSDIDEPELFQRTVPRELVHRAAISEVLLSGMRPLGDHRYRLGAQWPRGHSYYGPVAGDRHDPMLLAETVRQALLLISHEALNVPLGYHFLSHGTAFEVEAEAEGLALDRRPANVVIDAHCRDLKFRRNTVTGFDLHALFYRDGLRVGSGHMAMSCVPHATYLRLRGEGATATPSRTLPAPIAACRVGRRHAGDVVLGTTARPREWALRTDPDHPVLFDHPVDHVPGMVVLEAARQAAHAALGRPHALVVGCSATFHQYLEFGQDCRVSADTVAAVPGRPDEDQVTVSFRQAGAIPATCVVRARSER